MAKEVTVAAVVERLTGADARIGFSFVSRSGNTEQTRLITFPELAEQTAARAGALQAAGLKQGERIAIILPENDEFILTFLGAIRVGIIPVPIYPMHGLGQLDGYLENVRHIVRRSGAAAVVTNAKIKLLLGTVQGQCESVRGIISVESLADAAAPMQPRQVNLDDAAFLQFTSGSTSNPKGVTVTHRNLAANIRCFMEEGFRVTSEDVGVSWLPLFHDMGLIGFLLGPLFYQRPVAFIPPLNFLQRPLMWLEALSKYRASISCAPNFAFALAVKRIPEAQRQGLDLSAWRIAGCGGEPIRAEVLRRFATAFAPQGFRAEALLPMYGMAESSLAITLGRPGGGLPSTPVDHTRLSEERVALPPRQLEGALEIVACGKPFTGHKLSIFDLTDETSASPLPDGHIGEIRIAGPSVMKEYWGDPEATAQVFAGEYLRTGDLGFILNGELHVCGRLKEMIILNGRNYFPQDIEHVATTVPGVRKGNLVAFGTHEASDAGEGLERIVLAVEIADPASFDPLAVVRTVQASLGVALHEVVVLQPGQLPKTSSGKLQRTKTRELYERGELHERQSARETNVTDTLKQVVISQTNYLKAVLFK
ncbi:fatty acyl-AMP ligase [Archangium lipolyticum]|uniref:fatty acyl-AMP ligase n=1 Tax=Archangium lipolyticum TaxID=2970465 RepID=UPI00214A11D4|nr:fatty acyl-AMP ligase [Archangium lipolyticum]